MYLNHENPRIGDTILIEPALTAYAIRHEEIIHLYVRPEYRFLFHGHPHINTLEQPWHVPDYPDPCPSRAFAWSHLNRLPFAAGYFHQVGINPVQGDRLHYHYYGGKVHEKKDVVVIAPFAKSCMRHQGKIPNVQPDLEWWRPLIERITFPVISLGDQNDPEIPGTTNVRDEPLRMAVKLLQSARVVISVETGLLHTAIGVGANIVFLSSATPVWFCCPPTKCIAVRADKPDWNHDLVLTAVDRVWDLS